MNPQIRRLFFVFAFLFVALIATTTYWLWRAPDLEARQGNPSLVVRELEVKRGFIYAANGTTVLARNRQRKLEDGRTWYVRRYPRGPLTAHPVGYSTITRSRTGLEQSMNDFLTGSNANLSTIIDTTLDKLQGITREGNNVVTTLNMNAQRAAMDGLAGDCGAAVALDPRTGAVLALASSPSFHPNLVEENFGAIERITAPCEPAAPLLDRATAGRFVPGSTFKVITAAAALDTGAFTPESEFDDPGFCTLFGQRVTNFSDQGELNAFGRVTLAEALENSINSVFCNLGKELGADTVLEYAERFGFYDRPPIELPSERGAHQRPLPQRPPVQAGRPLRGRSRASGVRPGAPDRDAAPDGARRRGRGQRRRRHGAEARGPHHVARRRRHRAVRPGGVEDSNRAVYGSRADRHDDAGGRIGHGHGCPDSRRVRRRQDRYRRDRRRPAATTRGSSRSRPRTRRGSPWPSRSPTSRAPAA